MAPHTPPQHAQSSLVGGVCCDGSMGDIWMCLDVQEVGPILDSSRPFLCALVSIYCG